MDERDGIGVRGGRRRFAGRAARRGSQGMTLIEIMVVVAIIGMIAAAVVVAVIPALRENKEKTTQIRVEKVQAAAALYFEQNNECPTNVKALRDYGIGGGEKDSWGNDLQITCSRGTVEVRSAGPDGNFGNEDDVATNGEEEED